MKKSLKLAIFLIIFFAFVFSVLATTCWDYDGNQAVCENTSFLGGICNSSYNASGSISNLKNWT